jgi:hypothetical protein
MDIDKNIFLNTPHDQPDTQRDNTPGNDLIPLDITPVETVKEEDLSLKK